MLRNEKYSVVTEIRPPVSTDPPTTIRLWHKMWHKFPLYSSIFLEILSPSQVRKPKTIHAQTDLWGKAHFRGENLWRIHPSPFSWKDLSLVSLSPCLQWCLFVHKDNECCILHNPRQPLAFLRNIISNIMIWKGRSMRVFVGCPWPV